MLSFISTQQEPGKVSIMENGKDPILIMTTESGSISCLGINQDSGGYPLHCSEIKNRFARRSYHIWDTKYITDQGIVRRINPFVLGAGYSPGIIPNISVRETGGPGMPASGHVDGKKTKENLETAISEILSSDPTVKESYLDHSLTTGGSINFSGSPINLDIIDRSSDTYTDSVNLHGLIEFCREPGTKALGTIEIAFAKGGYSRILSYHLLLFSWEEVGLKMDNFIMHDPEENFSLEFLSGILHVSPVGCDECIINNCTIEYGKLN